MKILITGAKGQLGTELRRVLRNEFAEIGPIPAVYADAQVVGVDSISLDITDSKAVAAFMMRSSFDLVINCAAMTDVDGCEKACDAAMRVNAEGAGMLAREAARAGAKFVQISTDYVFAGDEPFERVETDPVNPVSAYGRSKLAGEVAVQSACSRSFIVRTAWLYGHGGRNFVKTILALGKSRDNIMVVDDQVGNPTSANDLAYEILRIAATENYGVYHCTNQGTCSWADFACAIIKESGLECSVERCTSAEYARVHPTAATRPKFSGLRNRHLERTLGDCMRPWRVALVDYLNQVPAFNQEV